MQQPAASVGGVIVRVRARRVIVDADLARLYGVPTKRLNEVVRRNPRRFPPDFAFRLAPAEAADLRSQNATARSEALTGQWLASAPPDAGCAVSHGGRRTLPRVFTEHGALMAANVLRSARAVRMSVYVVRAVVRQREELAANAQVLERLAGIDLKLLLHDETLRVVWTKLQPLLAPPPDPPRRRIGFHEKS
jgi:hypothetical protein